MGWSGRFPWGDRAKYIAREFVLGCGFPMGGSGEVMFSCVFFAGGGFSHGIARRRHIVRACVVFLADGFFHGMVTRSTIFVRVLAQLLTNYDRQLLQLPLRPSAVVAIDFLRL